MLSNQRENVCPEKTILSHTSQRSGLSSIKSPGDLSFATKKKQQNKLQEQFLRGGKKLAPAIQGWQLLPYVTPWLRAYHVTGGCALGRGKNLLLHKSFLIYELLKLNTKHNKIHKNRCHP